MRFQLHVPIIQLATPHCKRRYLNQRTRTITNDDGYFILATPARQAAEASQTPIASLRRSELQLGQPIPGIRASAPLMQSLMSELKLGPPKKRDLFNNF
jgi:hypothetical protein